MDNPRKKIAELVASLPATPSLLDISKFRRQVESMELSQSQLKPIKLALVSSFTSEMLVDPLIAHGYCEGFELSVYNAPFGQYMQEMLNPSSGLYKFAPEVVFFAVRLQDACPDLYDSFNSLNSKLLQTILTRWKTDWLNALQAFRAKSDALILCANYEQPAYPSLGLADTDSEPSQQATIADLNVWLRGLTGEIGNFYIADIDMLAARCGRSRWTEPRMWFLARAAISPAFSWDYVGEIIRLLRAVSGRSRKVLALDCDNTLWGGHSGRSGHFWHLPGP